MEFSNPAILLVIPILLLPLLVLEFFKEKSRIAVLPFPLPAGSVPPGSLRSVLRRLPPILRFFTLAFLLVALAGPRVPTDDIPIHREGVDIVVALDISTSMKALDFEPSDRFTVAKNTISKFVEGRQDDRIGLVVFAGTAYTQCPLTLDHSVFRNILDSVRMDVIEDGTAIGDALATAVNRLRDSEAKSKIIILLTDGDNNKGKIDPEKAAQLALEFGIRIHTIQVGRGGRVPYPVQRREMFTGRLITDVQHFQIPVNPTLLRHLAETTKGRYFVAGDSGTLEKVFEHIDEMEKTELPGEEFILYDDIYGMAALAALFFLLFDLFIRLFVLRRFP